MNSNSINIQNIRRSAIAAGMAIETARAAQFPAKLHPLGGSAKTEKGLGVGVETAVLYLLPARYGMSRGSMCSNFTVDCEKSCLGDISGRFDFDPNTRNAQVWRTAIYLADREAFNQLVLDDARRLAKRAKKAGYIPAIRLDGSSDTGAVEPLLDELGSLGVVAYDYTKSVKRAIRAIDDDRYHLVFSYAGTHRSGVEANTVLSLGGSASVVFGIKKGQPLPKTWKINGREWPVIDGDATGDVRFMDREIHGIPERDGFLVGLRFKSNKHWQERAERAGVFVQWP